MNTIKILTKSPQETIGLGKELCMLFRPGDIVGLYGDLGSGKTTFVKGLAAGLGIDKNSLHSPTFVLLNIYEGRLNLYHFDLYRIDNAKEIALIGYEEFFYGQGISVIEWAGNLGPLLPKAFLKIQISIIAEDKRLFSLSAKGSRYNELLEEFSTHSKRVK